MILEVTVQAQIMISHRAFAIGAQRTKKHVHAYSTASPIKKIKHVKSTSTSVLRLQSFGQSSIDQNVQSIMTRRASQGVVEFQLEEHPVLPGCGMRVHHVGTGEQSSAREFVSGKDAPSRALHGRVAAYLPLRFCSIHHRVIRRDSSMLST